ncbi:alcohol dehydrogenase catalytic domain-containing protein [Photobacterium damselae subsp. piscicida]|nr:alcohol dehydrogenase catalytic domain-containing protein [Photobacterium damselae subsp. piscicida]
MDYKLTDWGYATWNYPQIIGLDIAGVIEQVGKEISTFKVGDRVFGFLNPRQAGGFAEYVSCKPDALSHIPLMFYTPMPQHYLVQVSPLG